MTFFHQVRKRSRGTGRPGLASARRGLNSVRRAISRLRPSAFGPARTSPGIAKGPARPRKLPPWKHSQTRSFLQDSDTKNVSAVLLRGFVKVVEIFFFPFFSCCGETRGLSCVVRRRQSCSDFPSVARGAATPRRRDASPARPAAPLAAPPAAPPEDATHLKGRVGRCAECCSELSRILTRLPDSTVLPCAVTLFSQNPGELIRLLRTTTASAFGVGVSRQRGAKRPYTPAGSRTPRLKCD